MGTSIQLSNKTRDKLVELKGTLTYDEYINKMINQLHDGTNVNDISEIKRNPIAVTLEHCNLNGDIINEYNITFRKLNESKIGSIFEPKYSDNKYFTHQSAEIIFKDKDSVFLRVKTKAITVTGEYVDFDLIHIHLF